MRTNVKLAAQNEFSTSESEKADSRKIAGVDRDWRKDGGEDDKQA